MTAFRGSSRPPTPEELKLTAWSYSRLKTWRQCPFKLKCSAIDRIKELESPQQLEGQRVHKLSEDYLLGREKKLPKELESFGEDYKALRQCGNGLRVEFPLTFRADLSLADWFAKDAWLRVRFDALVLNDDGTCVAIDLKTGRKRPEDREQLSLYAYALFTAFANMQTVQTELWYVPGGEVVADSFERKDYARYKAFWEGEGAKVLAEREWLATPNGLCAYCHHRKSNGGVCQFG
jgi:RecB family exonuclease